MSVRRAFVLSLLAAAFACVLPATARAADALPWFHTYTLPGNYAVGGVDLVTVSSGNGLRTRRILMGSQLPPNAEIVAAFLYWETVWSGSDATLEQLRRQVRFRGQPVTAIKSSTQPLTAQCRANGNGQWLSMMRADVLRLLPLQLDANGQPTGRRFVNQSDLAAHGLAPHTVTLPDSGTLNVVPQSAGASLVVIYQDPNPAAPLTSIVVYDGLHVQAPGAETTLNIRGFVDVISGSPAKLTFVGGSGAANNSERVWFGTSSSALTTNFGTNPFPAGGLLTDRAWSNPTFPIPNGWRTGDAGEYGEQVATKIDHLVPQLPYDCLSTGAVIFSARTEDGDGDGLPTRLEDTSGLRNPAGVAFPDIRAMGARTDRKDLFVEIGAMWSGGWNSQTSAQVPAPGPHDHMPSPAVLKAVGDALDAAPDPADKVAVHFDVGPALGLAYRAALGPGPDRYIIVGEGLARGGERIHETACIEDTEPGTPPCRFPGFKGVVSWPAGFQFLALAPVAADGAELLDPAAAGWCESNIPTACRRRFDLDREGVFHYLLYAHARGVRKSNFPCLAAPDATGNREPVAYPAGTTSCGALAANGEYLRPKSVSGVAELPGRYAMVSLGLWDNAVGTTDMQANTTLHEIGHNLDLWHGGGKPRFTPSPGGLTVFVQPNCKPNHLSVMSYLFQATGVRDAFGNARPRFSGEVPTPIDESALGVGSLGLSPEAPFTSWYAPRAGSLGETLGLKPVTRHCDGTSVTAAEPETVRLETASPDALIDWAATGTGQHPGGQDVNFDGKKSGEPRVLVGHDDWNGVALNRLGFGRSMFGFSVGLGLDFGGLDFGGLDFGGLDFGGLDFGGLDFGGLDFGGLDFGGMISGLDFGGLDFGGLDFGGLDFGGLDFGGLDFGGLESEVDAELTREIVEEAIAPGGSTGPQSLKAFVRGTNGAGGSNSSVPLGSTWVPVGEPTNCNTLSPAQCHLIRLDWDLPSVGSPGGYNAFRVWDDPVDGLNDLPAADQVPDAVGSTTGQGSTTLVDGAELPNGQRFLYWVRGSTGGELGSPSSFVAVTAVNAAPVAVNDGGPNFRVVAGSPGASFPTVLANDTDADSTDKSAWVVALVSPPSRGALTLKTDGTFTYKPAPGYVGTDTFSYRVNNGTWTRGGSSVPLSANSNTATVTIEVVGSVNRAPAGTNKTVTTKKNTRYYFKEGDFGFSDALDSPPHAFLAVRITTLPGSSIGALYMQKTDGTWIKVAAGTFVPAASIKAGKLKFWPDNNKTGTATFTFQVQDNGGTANGGTDLDQSPNTMTVKVVH